ncbi:hypothetical protein C8J56DRAFT_846445 [Mycena floridula]|nr:hypothetical protein C8J56DRAFT_846445 [Mycena floridula]
MGLSLQAIQLIAGFIAAILHGIYLVTCVPGVRCLLWDTQHHKLRSLKAIHWTLTLASLTIFITNLLSLCLGMYRSVVVVMVATDPSSATRPVSNWVNLVKSICTYITIGVADGILIYRCWIVYYRQYYVIVLPILLWLADTACAAVLIWMQDTINAKSLVNVAKIQPLLKAFTALTIPVNVIATSMIVYRIWSVDHANAKFRTSTRASALRNVIRIIMESGLIYTASAIGTFGCYLAGSNAFYIGTLDSSTDGGYRHESHFDSST